MLRESAYHKDVLEATSYKFSYKMLKALLQPFKISASSSPAFMPLLRDEPMKN